MPDFRRVQSGQPLKIPASTFNAILDVTEAAMRQGGSQGAVGLPGRIISNTIVPIANATGSDLDSMQVVGIYSPLIGPDEDVDAFSYRPGIVGVQASDGWSASFAVTVQPIGDGEIGLACISGVCAVYLNVVEEWHRYAEITSDPTQLTTGVKGSAQIIWRTPGTGTQWALVRLTGPFIPPPPLVRLGGLGDNYSSGDTITVTPVAMYDNPPDEEDVTLDVRAWGALPTGTEIPSGTVIPYYRGPDGITYYIVAQQREVVTNIQWDSTSHKLQKKVRHDFGAFASTESDWIDIIDFVNCTTSGS